MNLDADLAKLHSQMFWVLFTATFLGVAVWESRRPLRAWSMNTGQRWGTHGLLFLVNALVRMVLLGTTPVAVAALMQGRGWALLGQAPLWLAIPVTVAALDLAKYLAHRLYHAVPWLWRVHRVHHSDPDFDIATGLRFHPLETLFGQLTEMAFVAALGPPVVGVVAAALVSTVINNVQHANANFSPGWERALRRCLMTPANHRLHHSADFGDQQTNFGELLPWWDRMAGTYRARPERGEAQMRVGLEGYREARQNGVLALLVQPLQADRETASSGNAAEAGKSGI